MTRAKIQSAAIASILVGSMVLPVVGLVAALVTNNAAWLLLLLPLVIFMS